MRLNTCCVVSVYETEGREQSSLRLCLVHVMKLSITRFVFLSDKEDYE